MTDQRAREEVWSDLVAQFGLPAGSVPTLALRRAPKLSPNAASVYLDTNHWIGLAKARLGRPDGRRLRPCYEALQGFVADGQVQVVLSTASYVEIARAIRSVRQRTDLADVMSEITRFRSMRRLSHLIGSQFALALHERVGRPAFPQRLVPFGIGCGFAFGGKEGPIMRMEGPLPRGMSMADAFGGEEAFADMMFRINEITEYLLLRGVSEEQARRLKDHHIAMQGMALIEQEQVRREVDLAERLVEDRSLKARLDEIVAARELYFELGPSLPGLLSQAGMTVEGFFAKGKEWVTDFLEDLPSFAVQKALKRRSFANASRDWSVNDVRDIDHMGIAVPYCDIVVTEQHAATVLLQAHLGVRLKTTVLHDLASLPEAIDNYRQDAEQSSAGP